MNGSEAIRKSFMPLIVSIVLGGLGQATAKENSPNIIFIMADDLGYGDLGCYGGDKISTPHVDQLAKEGSRFTQFYSGSPVCAPARCVLMTGMHSGHARIRGNSPKVGGEVELFGEKTRRLSLIGSEITIASVLKKAGYATGATGKWGIGEPSSNAQPTQMGFDKWLGYLNQNHAAYYYTDFLWRDNEKLRIEQNADGKKVVYSNDLMKDFALRFIIDHKEEPFFLYLPFTIPHAQMEVPDLGIYLDKPWPEEAKIYAAMVSRLDGYLGEIVRILEQLKISMNTVIFFTSDNGPVDNERTIFLESAAGLRGTKGTVYEGGIKVPLVIKWPGVVPCGITNDTVGMFADVFPTLVEMSDAKYSEKLDGVSLMPSIRGQTQVLKDRFLYWEYPSQKLWQAGRLENWKGIRGGTDQPLELYDLSNDPREERDLSLKFPSVVREFEKRFVEEHDPSPHWPVE